MRFMVDECTGSGVAGWLRTAGHEGFSVYDESRGAKDTDILKKAYSGSYILITNDKDFGELVFRFDMPHKGVVLLRLENERPSNKVLVLKRLLELYPDRLADNFVVITENQVRIIEP